MNRRDSPTQGEPTDVDSSFPGHRPGRGTWFRAHSWREDSQDGGCRFYASLPPARGVGGRFDLPDPRGTCYWANTALAAARDRLGRPGDVVAHGEVEGSSVSCVKFDPGWLADLLHADAARRGASQELTSAAPYDLSQRWAAAFDDAGFGGVRYQPRFSTERAEALASFGEAGVSGGSRSVMTSRPMGEVLAENRYTVLTAPRRIELSPLLD